MKKTLALLMVSMLALSSCVSREQADEKLARGCAAGIELFLTDGNKIKEIKNKTFGDSAEEGPGYRDVTLAYVESDGWADVDKEDKCVFAEEFGFMGTSYTSNIYQVKVGDQVYGKKGTEILGTYDDILKLTETVDKAMNGN